MPMRFAGELAALGTAVCWAAGSNVFAAAGRRMGSAVLNRLRIVVAVALLGTALFVVRGSPWPTWATPSQVGILAASGLVGFTFGDAMYFRSLVILGPGRAALVFSVAPIFTLLIAWPVLGELPGPLASVGIALTLGGVAWVLRERARHSIVEHEGSEAAGIAAAALGALGQAVGFVLSRMVLREGLDPLSATVIRASAGAAGLWALAVFRGEVRRTVAALRDRRGTLYMVSGAVLGPFMGVTLSLVALAFTQAAIASSIIATLPILTMFIAVRAHREPLTWRGLVGASVAVVGVIVLFLR